jgi:hypothetical protein
VLRHWLEANPREVLGADYEDLGFLAPPAARKAQAPRRKHERRAVQPLALPRSIEEATRRLGDAFRPTMPFSGLPE